MTLDDVPPSDRIIGLKAAAAHTGLPAHVLRTRAVSHGGLGVRPTRARDPWIFSRAALDRFATARRLLAGE